MSKLRHRAGAAVLLAVGLLAQGACSEHQTNVVQPDFTAPVAASLPGEVVLFDQGPAVGNFQFQGIGAGNSLASQMFAESFTLAQTTTINGIRIFSPAAPNSSNLVLSFWADNNGAPGARLTRETRPASSWTEVAPGLYEITGQLASGFTATGGTKYWAALTGTHDIGQMFFAVDASVFPFVSALPGGDTKHGFFLNDVLFQVPDGGGDVVFQLLSLPPLPNQAPTAEAGSPATFTRTSPAGASVPLNGSASTDPEGGVLTYEWFDGANPVAIATGATATVTLQVLGAHSIKLRVTDPDGAFSEDVVTITINNAPPVPNAGPDQTINITGQSVVVQLDGSGSKDVDGTIANPSWIRVLGNNQFATVLSPTITLGPGTHLLRLRVFDNDGLGPRSEDVLIIVLAPNAAPVADAGPPQTVTRESPAGAEVSLDGTASTDDAAIISYRWTIPPDPTVIATGPIPVVLFPLGVHVVRLRVTDGPGLFSEADVEITVLNAPPEANAGPTRTLPRTSPAGRDVQLIGSGTDVDGAIAGYRWLEGGVEIATGQTPTVTLALGTHDITLEVTDTDGATATSDVSIIIVNALPEADAGPDQAITCNCPTSRSVTLDGTGSSDVDGTIVSYSWRKGPTEIATGAQPSVMLATGPHAIRLVVTDNDGAQHDDEVLIQITHVNQPPTAAISGPTSGNEGTTLTFSGAGSTDPDGDALTYSWNFGDGSAVESGPAATHLSRSHAYADEGAGGYTVTLVVNDGTANSAPATHGVAVANVAPTAVFVAPAAAVPLGSSFQLALNGVSDPSATDVAAGFTYAFDCGDGSYGPLSASAVATCAATTAGSRQVRGKVQDTDGGFSQYTATVQVDAPPAPTPTCNDRMATLVASLNAIVNDAPHISPSRKAILRMAIAMIPTKVSHLTSAQKQFGVRAAQVFIASVNSSVSKGHVPAAVGARLVQVANDLIAVLRGC